MPKDPRVSAGVACAVVRDSKILLIKRKGSHASGLWALPGGWIDYGETPVETCRRELSEEMGLDPYGSGFNFFYQTSNIFPEKEIQSITLYYRTVDIEGEPEIREPDKCSEIRWVQIETAVGMDNLFPGLDKALIKLLDYE